MHGPNNALCILQHHPKAGFLERTGNIAKQKSPEYLADMLAETIQSFSSRQTLLAIDAPLRFPKGFVTQISGLGNIGSMPFDKQINNPLAYRACESYLFEATGKRPLSASFDQLTSLVFLVLRVFYLLEEKYHVPVVQLPYHATNIGSGVSAFECYPALLKPVKKPLKLGVEKKAAFDLFVAQSELVLKEEHEMDAQYCALFAVYEHLVNPSPFSTHTDYTGDLEEEGWIYGPY